MTTLPTSQSPFEILNRIVEQNTYILQMMSQSGMIPPLPSRLLSMPTTSRSIALSSPQQLSQTRIPPIQTEQSTSLSLSEDTSLSDSPTCVRRRGRPCKSRLSLTPSPLPPKSPIQTRSSSRELKSCNKRPRMSLPTASRITRRDYHQADEISESPINGYEDDRDNSDHDNDVDEYKVDGRELRTLRRSKRIKDTRSQYEKQTESTESSDASSDFITEKDGDYKNNRRKVSYHQFLYLIYESLV